MEGRVMKLVTVTIAAVLLAAIAVSPATAQQAPREVSQLDMNAVPTLWRESIRRVQVLLQARGFNPGPIDGWVGPMTREAVRNFQTRYGIQPRGVIDNQTLFALGAVELALQAPAQ
jgi:peptidoglycan hydrolase-like protein with peptidoglycan-binding domain